MIREGTDSTLFAQTGRFTGGRRPACGTCSPYPGKQRAVGLGLWS